MHFFAVANADELLAHQQKGDGQLIVVNVNPVEDGVRAMEGNHAVEGSRKRKAAEKGDDRPQPKRAKRDGFSRPQHTSVSGTLVYSLSAYPTCLEALQESVYYSNFCRHGLSAGVRMCYTRTDLQSKCHLLCCALVVPCHIWGVEQVSCHQCLLRILRHTCVVWHLFITHLHLLASFAWIPDVGYFGPQQILTTCCSCK